MALDLRSAKPEAYGVRGAKAAAIWRSVLPELIEAFPNIQAIDLFTLAMYCQQRAFMESLAEQIELDGPTVETKRGLKPHPLLSSYAKAVNVVNQCAEKIGLNALARRRLTASPNGGDDAAKEFEDF